MAKLFFASDIHGSARYLSEMLTAFEREGASRLVLLGDILYHGPRNDLPGGYAPKEVISLLSPYKDRILAVRGNCDTEVDQMVLPFPILADYAVLFWKERALYLSHGHKFGEQNPPPLAKGDYLICGHTHVPAVREHEDFTYINVGSVSIPKERSPHSYAVLEEDGTLRFKALSGEEYNRYSLQ